MSIYLLAGYAVSLARIWRNLYVETATGAYPARGRRAVAAAVVTIPILLTMALAGQSNRPAIAYVDAAAGSLHPALLITARSRICSAPPARCAITGAHRVSLARNRALPRAEYGPRLYRRAALLLLVFGAIRGSLWHRQHPIFHASPWCLILLYALGWYTPAFRVMYELLPGVSFFRRPADAVFLIGAIGALMSGYVAIRLFSGGSGQHEPSRRDLIATGAVVMALFAAALVMAIITESLARRHPTVAVCSSLVCACYRRPANRRCGSPRSARLPQGFSWPRRSPTLSSIMARTARRPCQLRRLPCSSPTGATPRSQN